MHAEELSGGLKVYPRANLAPVHVRVFYKKFNFWLFANIF
jgi:hypothetical protein